MDRNQWSIISPFNLIPRQINSIDCGVHCFINFYSYINDVNLFTDDTEMPSRRLGLANYLINNFLGKDNLAFSTNNEILCTTIQPNLKIQFRIHPICKCANGYQIVVLPTLHLRLSITCMSVALPFGHHLPIHHPHSFWIFWRNEKHYPLIILILLSCVNAYMVSSSNTTSPT
jgi:hypothetical protein